MKRVIPRKVSIAAGEKLTKDIYLNKRKRGEIKKKFLELQKSLLENVDTTEKPVTKEEYDLRLLNLSFADLSVGVLHVIKEAEDWDKELKLSDCNFILFKKAKEILFMAKFTKPLLDKTKRTTYVYLPQGLPVKSKKKAFKIKDKFDLSGFNEVDHGKFKQYIIDFYTMSLDFKGKNERHFLKFKTIDDKKQTYWTTYLKSHN